MALFIFSIELKCFVLNNWQISGNFVSLLSLVFVIMACMFLYSPYIDNSLPTHRESGWEIEDCVLLHFVIQTCESKLLLGMRRYGDISTQYWYIGPRYVSFPSAIYRDTTLTFVIRRSHCVFTVVSVFNRFKILFLEKFHFLIHSNYYFSCKYM